MKRLLQLLLCLAIGGAVAAAAWAITASPWSAVAVPAAVAVGWLAVADPSRCEAPPSATRDANRPSRSRSGPGG